MSLTKSKHPLQDVRSKLIARNWYSLPWEDTEGWDEAFRFSEFDCHNWQFWGCASEPVILAVCTSRSVVMGFDLADSDHPAVDVIHEAQEVIRQTGKVA